MSRKLIIALVAIASLGLFAAPSAQAHGDETVTARIWVEVPAVETDVLAQGTAASTYVHDRLTITVGLQVYTNGGWQTLAVGSKTVWNAKTVSKQVRGDCLSDQHTYRVYVAYTFVQNQVVSDSGTRYLAQQSLYCAL